MEELDRLIMHLNGDGGIKVDGDPIQLAVDYLKELRHQNNEFGELVDRADYAESKCYKMDAKLDDIESYVESLSGNENEPVKTIYKHITEIIRRLG